MKFSRVAVTFSPCFVMLWLLNSLFQLFIELASIRKCFTQKGGIFVLEEFGKTVAFLK